jgi:sacsin
VALEIEDPALNGSIEIGIDEDVNADADLDPTYIFVHVVKKLESESKVPLMQEYQINDGTEINLTVKAYQLYKFIRKPKKYDDEGMYTKEMQVMIYSRNAQEEESKERQQPVSFKDACKEIRMSLNEAWKLPDKEKSKIVKRLLLKWHPDKNPENVPFCTKVFQYIQQCIRRLEEGLTLIDNDEENERSDNRSGSPRGKNRYRDNSTYWSSSRFGRFWERYEKRRTFYKEENSRSHDESYSGQNTRGATFTMPETKPFHYYAEARRWQKQAKSDLHNSAISLQKAPSNSYNWVCYMAHQV